MPRNYLWLLILPSLLLNSLGSAASRVERGNLIFDNIPDAPADLTEKLDGYLSARQATPLGWSPKGQLLITTRFGDADQLHVVEKPQGERRQITFLHEPITEAAFSPDPGRSGYLFMKDAGGNENAQLYYQRMGEPAAKLLTDGKSLNGAPIWSNSGREIAFFTTARDGVSYDIDIVEPEAGTLPHLAVSGDNTAAWYPLDWSPDDRRLLVLKYVSIAEGYLYVVDLSSGQKREVDPAPAKVGIAGAKFSRDGQGVYLISDRDAEFGKQSAGSMDAQRSGRGGYGQIRDAALGAVSHVRSARKPCSTATSVRVRAGQAGSAPRAPHAARRSRVAVPPGLRPVDSVRGE
jgi:hypothetical protein